MRNTIMDLLHLFNVKEQLGDSRKYPYPTTGGMNILTPLALGNSKI